MTPKQKKDAIDHMSRKICEVMVSVCRDADRFSGPVKAGMITAMEEFYIRMAGSFFCWEDFKLDEIKRLAAMIEKGARISGGCVRRPGLDLVLPAAEVDFCSLRRPKAVDFSVSPFAGRGARAMSAPEKICNRCRRVCFSEEEFANHPCFDMDDKLDAEIAVCKFEQEWQNSQRLNEQDGRER